MHRLPIGGYGVRLPEASSAMDLVGKTMLGDTKVERSSPHDATNTSGLRR